MENNELHLGDVIVIIDRNARNYLKIGSVIETNTDKYTYVVEFVVTEFSMIMYFLRKCYIFHWNGDDFFLMIFNIFL